MTKCLWALPALLLTLACGATRQAERFYPWEAGLTLVYENPQTLDAIKRVNERLQIRVASAAQQEDGSLLMRVAYSTFAGEITSTLKAKDGGVRLCSEQGQPLATLLPDAFPTAHRWSERGSTYTLIGRALSSLPKDTLPPDHPTLGVWVECVTPAGLRRRTFYLPDLGEAETLVFENGRWICVNRLVGRHFMDVPPPRSETK